MLSIEPLKSAAKVRDYYQKDNYYVTGGETHQGQWFGEGAARLNLVGDVELDTFEAVLNGHLSADISLERTDENHRPGYDLTFSAPKSVSILAVLLNAPEILNAHRLAVQGILDFIEKNYVATRVTDKGQKTIEKTGNLVIAVFEHTDSRALDPNLHSHSVIANATQREDGSWRTIDSYEIFHDKIMLGMRYRAILAQELMKLGYEIVQTSDKGTFELKDFPPELIKKFSKRRAQIEAYMAEHGLSGAEGAKIANLNTRSHKRRVDFEHLQLAYTVELAASGHSVEWLQGYCIRAKNRGPIKPPDPEALACDAVLSSVRHLSEWQGVFTLAALRKSAMALSLTNHSEQFLQQAIDEQFKHGTLLYLGENLCTTQSARDLEIQNISLMRLGKKQIKPIFSSQAAKLLGLQTFKLDPQKSAVLAFLLTHTDRHIALVCSAKADFKAVMEPYLRLIEPHYFYPTGLTQNANRVKSFGEELGLKYTKTITGFLFVCEKRLEKQPYPKAERQLKNAREVWIIDPKTSIMPQQILEIQRYARHFGARVIWGLEAHSGQSEIKSLINRGMQHYKLDAHPNNRMASLWVEKDVASIFKHFEEKGQITAIPILQDRLKAATQKYLSLGAGVNLVALTHYERNALNQAVREARIVEGHLKGEAIIFQTLQPIALSLEQRAQPQFWQLNDIVKLTKEHEKLKCSADTYLRISDIQVQNKKITLVDDQGTVYVLKLNRADVKNLQLYKPKERALQINDEIHWTQTYRCLENRAHDRLKGEKARVMDVSNTAATLVLNNQEIIHLKRDYLPDSHWDYGYASLLANTQLKNAPSVMVLKSQTEILNYEAFAKVLRTHTNESLHIFCDDVRQVKENLLAYSGEKIGALEQAVIHYQPSAQKLETPEQLMQEFFPDLSERLLEIFKQEPDILQTVMAEYEAEKVSLFKSIEEPVCTAASDLPEGIALATSSAEIVSSTHREDKTVDIQRREVRHMIDWICSKYGERDAVFLLENIKNELFKRCGLSIPEKILEEELIFTLKQGFLIPVDGKMIDLQQGFDVRERLVTTREMLLLEKACVRLTLNAQKVRQSILAKDDPALLSIDQSQFLTKGQKSALELILTTGDGVVGIQGVAGVGKTTLLRTLNQHALEAGYELLGLSNGTKAREILQEGSRNPDSENPFLQLGIKTMTTRKFLIHCGKLLKNNEALAKVEYGGPKILILDESSFASTRDMFLLMSYAAKLNILLVMMGDYKQLSSIEAGRIFYVLLGSKMQSVAMTENVRFNSAKALEIMQAIYKGEIGDVLEKLGVSLIEIPEREERLQYIANFYLENDADSRKKILVITPLNKDKAFVNDAIHVGLKERGELTGEAFKVQNLMPRNLTQPEKEKIYAFEKGDWIRFNQGGRHVEGNQYYKIRDHDYSDQTLLLEKSDGSRVIFSPDRDVKHESGAIEVYRGEDRQFMINEKIRWLRNDEKRGIRNGETAVIRALTESKNQVQMEVLLKDERVEILNLSECANKHWDYAYASTAFVAQGDSKHQTIGHALGGTVGADGHRYTPKSTSIEELLVTVTRGDNVTIVVDSCLNYQEALLDSLNSICKSVHEYIDPNRLEVSEKLAKMVENITGKVDLKKDETEFKSEIIKGISPKTQLSTKKPFYDKAEIIRQLNLDILGNASLCLGAPLHRNAREARWGKNGSFVLTLSGTKAGYWYDFESGQGGKDLISLYVHHYGSDYSEELKTLAESLGLSPEGSLFKTSKQSLASEKRIAAAEAKHQKEVLKEAKVEMQKLKDVRVFYEKCIPVEGTLAEKYLRKGRGIKAELPGDFRFCAKVKHRDTKLLTPALIVPIRNIDNEISAIARIFLDKNGNQLNTTYENILGEIKKAAPKLNFGGMKDAGVMISKTDFKGSDVVYIAEGIETALSVAEAIPHQTIFASLSVSHLQNMPIPKNTQKIILCADEDGASANSERALIKTANRYCERGYTVQIAYPSRVPNLDKTDFNDVLKDAGIKGVVRDFKHTISVQSPLTSASLLQLKRDLERTKGSSKSIIQPSKELEHEKI